MIKYLKFLIQVIITLIAFVLALIGLAMGIAMIFLFIKGLLGMAFCFLGTSLDFWGTFIVTIQGAAGILSITSLFAIGCGFFGGLIEWLD